MKRILLALGFAGCATMMTTPYVTESIIGELPKYWAAHPSIVTKRVTVWNATDYVRDLRVHCVAAQFDDGRHDHTFLDVAPHTAQWALVTTSSSDAMSDSCYIYTTM